jgi:Maltogenic Amylase, C-terminal domain
MIPVPLELPATEGLEHRAPTSPRARPATHHLTAHAPANAAWYRDAVIAVLPALRPLGPDRGAADFGPLVPHFDLLRRLGVTCVLVPVPVHTAHIAKAPRQPAGTDFDGAGFARFERLFIEAHARDLRVLVDASRPRPGEGHGFRPSVDAGDLWLHMGADAVVVPPHAARAMLAQKRGRSFEPAGGAGWFSSVDGVPVPIWDEELTELGWFRAHVPLAILEGIERETSGPLLALLVRFALRRACGAVRMEIDDAARASEGGSTAGSPASARPPVLDTPRRLRLFDRLLFSLPGPILLASDRDVGLGPTTTCAGAIAEDARRSSDIKTLIALRMECAALRYGGASPVSLGGGPGLAFVCEFGREIALVVANVAARPVEVRCDLNGYQGRRVIDMIRGKELPPVTDASYPMRLDPLDCCWLRLIAG